MFKKTFVLLISMITLFLVAAEGFSMNVLNNKLIELENN